MQWDDSLLGEQREVASHIGTHALLLAGPGTGKTLTLTRRVAFLVSEKNIPPEKILVLTFTRAAAYELRKRVVEILGEEKGKSIHISTLHSFALRQLLRNSDRLDTVPRPLRIADDWEERNIIYEDLKNILDCSLKEIRIKFNKLSADWETLTAEEEDWEESFPDPRFLGAWGEHRNVYGYTLRSELVYQLKRALEQTSDFSLESEFSYLLIDEYQDLNNCDLAIISILRDNNIEVFVAGDDDQSIYGFRYAHPDGIRNFERDYNPSTRYVLKTCVRCDRKIISFSKFIANLDPRRLAKPLEPKEGAGKGEVHLLSFRNQNDEAKGVAKICKYLIEKRNYAPNDILILMRNDNRGAFSSPIKEALENEDIPVAIPVDSTPMNTKDGRIFLSFLHLLDYRLDNLALRTLFDLRENGIGEKTILRLYQLAHNNGETFSEMVYGVMEDPSLLPNVGERIARETRDIQRILEAHRNRFESLSESTGVQNLLDALRELVEDTIPHSDIKGDILRYLKKIIEETGSTTHRELLRTLSSSIEFGEQELDPNSVNIMTMHRAKGLTAKAVIIIAVEDEYIPGRQTGEGVGDERRLLYVSISRARHFLVMTYCERRRGQQRHTGREPGRLGRTLTRFLRDGPVKPIEGSEFVEGLS